MRRPPVECERIARSVALRLNRSLDAAFARVREQFSKADAARRYLDQLVGVDEFDVAQDCNRRRQNQRLIRSRCSDISQLLCLGWIDHKSLLHVDQQSALRTSILG